MENEILVTISFPIMIQMDVKTKYKAKKTKIVFFDIDDTLRVKVTGYMPESIKYVFKSLKEKGIIKKIAGDNLITESPNDFIETDNGKGYWKLNY